MEASKLVTWFWSFLILMFASCMVTTAVNTCNSSYFYCVNTTHYQQCVGTSLTTMNNPQECDKSTVEVACNMMCRSSCAAKTDSCQDFKCTEKGKVANPNNCKQFYQCVIPTGSTEYVQYNYTCPGNPTSYYDTGAKGCVLSSASCGSRPL